MKRQSALTLIIFMVIIGAVSGLILHWFVMSMHISYLIHCILLGCFFGFMNGVIALLFFKYYEKVKTKNKKLLEQLRLDKLTGLFNRNAFDNDMHEFNGFTLVSMIFLDIDNFRDFNNKHGHQIGDSILAKCSNIIINNIRRTDRAYRYGGDEIVIILPQCDKKEAEIIANKIIKSSHVPDIDYPFLTFSVGVASIPNDAKNLKQLIKCSDTAMIQAKRNGKNQVCVY